MRKVTLPAIVFLSLLFAMFGFSGCRRSIPSNTAKTSKPDSNLDLSGRALIDIAHTDNVTKAKELLDKGVSANVRGSDGNTPIMEAAYARQTAMAKLLLDYGADLSAKKNDGATPLSLVDEHTETAALLRSVGKLVDAAAAGDIAKMQALIDGGIPLNGLNVYGRTALTEACWNGKTDAVRFLIEKGANPTIKKSDGASPVDLAAGQKHQDIVDLLNAAIGKTKSK